MKMEGRIEDSDVEGLWMKQYYIMSYIRQCGFCVTIFAVHGVDLHKCTTREHVLCPKITTRDLHKNPCQGYCS